jgi:predicted amidohydrolase
MFLAAVIQLNSTSNGDVNLQAAQSLIERAAAYGAQLVATPETTNFVGSLAEQTRHAETLNGPTCTAFSQLASRLGIYLLLGSFMEKTQDPTRAYNTSVLFQPNGSLLAAYRKIHLFDVELSERMNFQESANVLPGNKLEVATTPLGRLGMSICYDLRYSRMYWSLVDQGAEILLIPSAFTSATGKDHWEPLLRARAIEFQAYVLAPNQWGRHDELGKRESHGHSMVVDPWGQVIASVPNGAGIALAEIDLARVHQVRQKIPMTSKAEKISTPVC